MIFVVILSVGMIAVFVSSIYSGIRNCNKQIENQNISFQKIDGRIDGINNEIANIKIEQATVKAIQTIGAEAHRKDTTGPPINIYQQPAPPSYVYPMVQAIPPLAAGYSYVPQTQQVQTQMMPSVQPQQVQRPTPKPVQIQQTVQPQVQRKVPKPVQIQQEVQPQVQQYTGNAAQQQTPEAVQKVVREQVPQKIKENTQDPVQSEVNIFQQRRMPEIGFTEFQLPEEYDIEDEINIPVIAEASPQIRAQVATQERPEPRPEIIRQQRTEQRPEIRPQPRPAFIYPQEKLMPSKFISLNDGISRTGKRYSEEELAFRILD